MTALLRAEALVRELGNAAVKNRVSTMSTSP